ncbi:DegT/DnrJ/EryC1/StrS family aminotransferase [Flavobacteriaceae bacterium]|nr:DegT/DnrJ/EryC1/StrS family aminotransferase [Flavobacteriaceae bacterium]
MATQARYKAPHYQHTEIGYNYKMSNVLTGIGRWQMEVFDKHIQLRRNLNQFYKALFKDIDGLSIFKEASKDYFSNNW